MIATLTLRLVTAAVAGAGATLFLAGPVPAFAAPGAVTGTVNTGGGSLNVRAGASANTNLLDRITNGRQITIECQTTGQSINGNTLWDRIGPGRYVTDAYVNRSQPVPNCSTPPPPPAAQAGPAAGTVNTGGGSLNVRAGASANTNLLDRIANGRQITIECQTTGQSINGNTLWDRIGPGRYVTDAYVNRSQPVPNCSTPPAPPAAQAGPVAGIVSTGDGPLNVRAGASTSKSVLDRVPDGSQITIECQTAGDRINGTNLWDRIAPGRFVTDAFVMRNGSPVSVCPPTAVAPPPPGVTGTWVVPVPDRVGQGFRPISNPTHDGVDIMEPRYTPIRATSDGIVITMECNTSGPSCNVDGSPAVRGCGWYVEVQHPGQVITRYCHMVRRPEVNIGQHVSTGQILGYVGMSGNTSGPHLHFEVHVGGSSADSSNAVDPIPFMRSVGAPLAGT